MLCFTQIDSLFRVSRFYSIFVKQLKYFLIAAFHFFSKDLTGQIFSISCKAKIHELKGDSKKLALNELDDEKCRLTFVNF
jgi:hypothetical protein